MTRWVPFFALTAAVLFALLGLARLSSAVVRDDGVRREPREPDPDRLGEPTASRPRVTPTAAGGGSDVPREASDGSGTVSPLSDGPTPDTTPDAPPDTTPDAPPDTTPDAPPDTTPDVPPDTTPGRDAAGESARVELSSGMLLANVALTQGLVGLALVAGIVWFDVPGGALGVTAAPWVGGLPAVGLGVGFGLALWLGNEAAAGVADAVGAAYDEVVRGMLAPDSLAGWLILLGLVLPTVAFVEELLFRGALIGVPAAATGLSPWLLAVVSSVAFALGHGAQGRVGVAVTGVLGLVLAAGYVLSGSLLVVVVAHYVVNAMEFVVHEGLGYGRLL